jgi:hypothetical protein
MKVILKRYLLMTLGWLSVIIGLIGVVLPILPTTPFMILALGCFAKSSPRFHTMLLNNKFFGPPLQQWERNKTVTHTTKLRAMGLIVLTFTASILVLWGRVELQVMLVVLCLILLFFVARLKETQPLQDNS